MYNVPSGVDNLPAYIAMLAPNYVSIKIESQKMFHHYEHHLFLNPLSDITMFDKDVRLTRAEYSQDKKIDGMYANCRATHSR